MGIGLARVIKTGEVSLGDAVVLGSAGVSPKTLPAARVSSMSQAEFRKDWPARRQPERPTVALQNVFHQLNSIFIDNGLALE
jgi:hypothetical protein